MSALNYDRRPDDDDLYYSGDEEIYSTVRVEQTHSDISVSHNDENHDDVRASDNEVHKVWIRRAKGRVSSTTTKFVRSCILWGSTASFRATVSYLPVKSNSVASEVRLYDCARLDTIHKGPEHLRRFELIRLHHSRI